MAGKRCGLGDARFGILRQRQEDFSSRTCLDAGADEGVYATGNLGDTVSRNG